ncbi:transposable element Tcb2 transposase [Trichonephila clavipes]|nr:transposable element Tcb2 transposase [Trichonephila clavipes]
MGFGSRLPTRVLCSMLDISLHVMPWQESTETEVYRTRNELHEVMSLDSNFLTMTGASEYGVRLKKTWILHASVELYKEMVVQSWSGVFFVVLLRIIGASTSILTSFRNVYLLDDHLLPFMLFCFLHDSGIFQQDNCTSQKSRLATGCLDEHSCDFSSINWTPRSLDVNPIEPIWDILEQGVKAITQH